MQENYVEIVSSDAARGVLKSIGINIDNIIKLPLSLSIGKLDGLNTYSRTELKDYYPVGKFTLEYSNYSFKEEIDKINHLLITIPNIRVWSSHLNADEYLLLMYICYLYPNNNICVMFSEEVSWNLKSIGEMTSKEILELTKRQHNLRQEDILNLENQFMKIIKDNVEVRVIKEGSIENTTIDNCANIIFKELNSEINKNIFIGRLIGNNIIPGAEYDFYELLINYLSKQNKICVLENEIIKINS